MCNRYRMTAKQAELARRYGIVSPYPDDLTISPSELFPGKPAYVASTLLLFNARKLDAYRDDLFIPDREISSDRSADRGVVTP